MTKQHSANPVLTFPRPLDECEAPIDTETEWLEPDGLGGFASGTTLGIPTRRYHALLLASLRPPSDRWVLANGFVAWLETQSGRIQLTRHHYAPGVTTAADARVVGFASEPWPCFRYVTNEGLEVRQEIVVQRGRAAVLLRFRLETPVEGVRLCLRPLLSGRNFHALHHENAEFRFEPEADGRWLEWSPYPGVPSIRSWSNGSYRHAPDWYRRFRYAQEQARGLDCDEDLASPGILDFDLSREPALWLLATGTEGVRDIPPQSDEATAVLQAEAARRSRFSSRLERSAEAYFVRRGEGLTILAGYPWFSDWGRDTFIALRGLCLATGRLEEARSILLRWSSFVSAGMLPNRFPDQSDREPEYNSVDASLWYVIAASELLAHPGAKEVVSDSDRRLLRDAMREIVEGYARGTRFGIVRDEDGLLRSGTPGSQLTWMDAKIGDHVVTPRSGKPVEVQALWLNALFAVLGEGEPFRSWLEKARVSFEERFWNPTEQALYDVVDGDEGVGQVDASVRPNQIFAAGGLPLTLLSTERARSVVEIVESELWTPLGLRSLSPRDSAYSPRYQGDVWARDSAYHQGSVWPWLLGAFVEAWVKTRGGTDAAKRAARARFLAPLHEHLNRAGIGHISEIADAEPPHAPRGCPFQSWSLAEFLRLELVVLRV